MEAHYFKRVKNEFRNVLSRLRDKNIHPDFLYLIVFLLHICFRYFTNAELYIMENNPNGNKYVKISMIISMSKDLFCLKDRNRG